MQTMIYYGENNKAFSKYYGTLIYHEYTWYYTKKLWFYMYVKSTELYFFEKTLKNVENYVTIPQNRVRKQHNFYVVWFKLTLYTKKR